MSHIKKDLQYKRPWLYEKQEKAIFNDSRYSVVEASTKSGKTVGCIIWIFEQALEGEEGYNYWWVAPVDKQASIAWRRFKAAVPKQIIRYKNENDKLLTISNGASLWFKTGDDPDNLYGEDVYAAVIDEASRVKEESWHAIRSTLTATQGPVRIIGNVKGKKNWAYKLARKAQKGADNMSYHKITAWDAVDAGVLEEKEILDAKATLPEAIFQELYLAEAADDGGNPFGLNHIRECIYRNKEGNPTRRMPDTKPICWGWDVAKARNYTVGIGLDEDGHVCRFHRWKDSWEATFRRIVRLTGNKPAVVDSTGTGDQFVERLQSVADFNTNFEGYKFTAQSKQDLMVGLAVTIQNKEIRFPDGPIVEELEMFEYEHRADKILYRAPEGHHDDCVDALAMAVYKYNKIKKSMVETVAPLTISQQSHWKRLT